MKTMPAKDALARYFAKFDLSPNLPGTLRNMATRDYGPAGEKQRWLADWNRDRDQFLRGMRVITGSLAGSTAMAARYYYVMSRGRYQNERQAWADAIGFGDICLDRDDRRDRVVRHAEGRWPTCKRRSTPRVRPDPSPPKPD